jgi:hypothetical protein
MSKNQFHSPKRENIIVSFSGGRTSAFMCWWLISYMSHIYNFHFVYANTGLEHEKTLKFVDQVDKYLNLNLTWLEAVINPIKGIGTSYTIVDYKSACKDNRLFKDMCEVYGLMNQTYIHCTRELKIQPIKKFSDDYFGKTNYRRALGIRYDEPKRVKADTDYIFPLATITKITKEDVLNFWKQQPFDLEIDEHYGNCVGCYKKSDKKLKMIADESPEHLDPFIELETLYSNLKNPNEELERKIYRHYRTAYEVKNNLSLPDNLTSKDECAEECGTVDPDFKSERIELNLFDFAS